MSKQEEETLIAQFKELLAQHSESIALNNMKTFIYFFRELKRTENGYAKRLSFFGRILLAYRHMKLYKPN